MLTIADLCAEVGTHAKKVSETINQGFGMNFNDFINQHRIEAIIDRFESGAHHKLTILGIAFDCGFNSKSTFNRAFKRYTALSPKAYLEKKHPTGAKS